MSKLEASPPSDSGNRNSATWIGVGLGIVYGLLMRFVFEYGPIESFIDIVSRAFLILTPFSVGAISVYIPWRRGPVPFGKQVMLSSVTMVAFILSMFLFFIEGLVCIVLVLPIFVVMSIVGGVAMGAILHYTNYRRGAIRAVLLLPLLVAPLEHQLPSIPETRLVTTSITINAPAEQIWQQLGSVKDIKRSELPFALVHFMGVPYPLEAEMKGEGLGALRTSTWEKGVTFGERITAWNPPHQMVYEFEIAPDSIPKDALDRHVEMGGEYFTVLNGGYTLMPLENGSTEVTLHTVYQNRSSLKLYGAIWGDFILDDFHHVILSLISTRTLATSS